MPSPAYGEIQQPLKVLQNRYSNNVASTLLPYTKINSKWLKDLNIRQDAIKLLKRNIGKAFSDINCTTVFLGQSPKAVEIKTKINLMHSKENHKQNEKTTYRQEENICK